MLKKLLTRIENYLNKFGADHIDAYIHEKKPRDLIELEYWLRQYERSKSVKSWF